MFSALIDDTTLQIPTFNQRYDLGHGDFVDALASFPGTLLNIPISMANAIPAGFNAPLKTASVLSGHSQEDLSNEAVALMASSGPAAPLIFAGELPLMPGIIMNRVNRIFKGGRTLNQLDRVDDLGDQTTIPSHLNNRDPLPDSGIPELPDEIAPAITVDAAPSSSNVRRRLSDEELANTEIYDRTTYGGAGTNGTVGQRIRAEMEGQPCPECDDIMVSGTKTAPWPQHNPTLRDFHYNHGGKNLTDAERKAYAKSEEAYDKANCKGCQLSEGGREAAKSKKNKKEILEARERLRQKSEDEN